jgi:hypothetical protein
MRKYLMALAILMNVNLIAADSQVIDIYFVGNFPPLIFMDQTSIKGYLPDKIDRVLKNKNVKPHYRILPWKRAQAEIHLTPGAIVGVKNAERMEVLNFSNRSIFSNKQVLIKLKSSKLDANKSVVDLVRIRGYVSGFEEKLKAYPNQLEVDSLEQAFKLLISNRAVWVLGNELSLLCTARQLKVEIGEIRLLGMTEVYLATSKKFGRNFLDLFDAAMGEAQPLNDQDPMQYCQ